MADWRAWVRKIRQKTKSILRRRSGRGIGTSTSAHSTGGNTSSNTVVRHVVNTGHDNGFTYSDVNSAATAGGEVSQSNLKPFVTTNSPSSAKDAESCHQFPVASSATHIKQCSAVAACDAPTLLPIYHAPGYPPLSRAPTFRERLRAYSAHHPHASSSTTDAEIRDLRPEEVGTRRYRMAYANEPYGAGAEDGGFSDEELTKPCPQSERSFEL